MFVLSLNTIFITKNSGFYKYYRNQVQLLGFVQKTSQLPSNPRAEQRAALCDEGPVKDVWAAGAARDAAVVLGSG